ncbi:hypothetical protein LIG30_4498, partial [Burkholderia sp. lig30]
MQATRAVFADGAGGLRIRRGTWKLAAIIGGVCAVHATLLVTLTRESSTRIEPVPVRVIQAELIPGATGADRHVFEPRPILRPEATRAPASQMPADTAQTPRPAAREHVTQVAPRAPAAKVAAIEPPTPTPTPTQTQTQT